MKFSVISSLRDLSYIAVPVPSLLIRICAVLRVDVEKFLSENVQ